MFKLMDFLETAVPPVGQDSVWFDRAVGAVDYLVQTARTDEIILYSNVGQSYVHSILATQDKITPPDWADLRHAHAAADSRWALEHVSGGGEPDRMYLADPLNHPGCRSLVGGEQLVFRRRFTDVDKGPMRTELSQRLVQALDLYFLEEESAYCRLNDDGDVQPVIRLRDLSREADQPSAVLVTIDAEQLHRYMAVTETALVMQFDFTRYKSGSFRGWHDPERGEFEEGDLCHHSGLQGGASFVTGALVVRPVLTKGMMIAKARRDWDGIGKEYATFKAHDWKNNRMGEISCAPAALSNYFEPDSPLPYELSPAFFRPEVLQKYKGDPEKYTLEHRSIGARGGWYLKSYDVNEAGQVHAYLYDLAKLPFREQLYWQSFNEWPKVPLSKRAIQTDFEGNFSTIPDALMDIKYEVSKLDKLKPDWWKPRGEGAALALHYPLTASPDEWGNSILALDQLVVEGFVEKALRGRLQATGGTTEKDWRSLRLLEACLVLAGLDDTAAAEIVEPFKRVHALRSKVKGHLAASERQAIIKQARIEHGSLAAHFKKLAEQVQASLDRVVELL